MPNYHEKAKILKALADGSRLKIVDILSCGERCACDILEHFDFTQPTLSHHMKVLTDMGIVGTRKEGIWNYYSLSDEKHQELQIFLDDLFNETENCICKIIDLKNQV